MIYHGDCLEVLRTLPDCSVDAVVTDPPYGLSFMGKKWDYDVPSVEVWAECLRVLKPGGHLLAFAGTRTQHRMAVRIEDAGFEIRDMIAWVYSQGFPKSHNLDNLRGDKICGCAEPYAHHGTEQKTKCDVRLMRNSDVPQAEHDKTQRREILQQGVPEQSTSVVRRAQLSTAEDGCGKYGVEGWGDAPEASRKLCSGAVRQSTDLGAADGARGWLRDGASSGDGEMVRISSDAHGVRSPRRPQSAEQSAGQSGVVAGQPKSQTMGAWPVCSGCGLPRVPSGLGTALKPSLEPVTVARKPLIGTVAENVLAWGTGAINVDGCRVGTNGGTAKGSKPQGDGKGIYGAGLHGACEINQLDAGRWPANLIHDGSEEVLAGFPTTTSGGGDKHGKKPSTFCASTNWEAFKGTSNGGDTGSAARFFYCAKASKSDRNSGGVNSTHPTVKPTDLMRYLCRLVTPPGGTVLDPFMGSGSTGKAAVLEGLSFIGIEREAEYVEIAKARIAAVQER